jgi:hypothetical protein
MRAQPEYYATLAGAARIRSTATVMTTLSRALTHVTRRSNLFLGCNAAADMVCLLVQGNHSHWHGIGQVRVRWRSSHWFKFVAFCILELHRGRETAIGKPEIIIDWMQY